MKLNNITSELLFLGCSVKKMDVNNHLISLSDNVEKSFGMDIEPIRLEENEDGFYGEITLLVEVVLDENGEFESSIKMEINGAFRAEKDNMTEEKFKKLVLVNGAAALYSIARSKIEVISGMIFFKGKLILPFVNMCNFYRDKFSE